MGTLHITFDIPGERALSSYFEHMYHVPDDFRDVWEQMSEDFWAQNEQTFAEEGPGWRPLAPSTRWDRLYRGYPPSHPILVRTGALRDSLTDGTAEGAIYEVYPQELTLGSDLKTKNGYTLATLHQFGSMKVADHPPKRPPVQITGELQTRWNQRLATWLREEFAYGGE